MTDDPLAFVRHLTPILDRCVEEGECLLWTGGCLNGGTVPVMRLRRVLPALPGSPRPDAVAVHRVMWEEAFGQALPAGWSVWRTCVHPRCVHPLHLKAGTKKAMVRWQAKHNARRLAIDARLRITAVRRSHDNIKLGMDEARHIRAQRGSRSAVLLAADHGVDVSMIYKIWAGEVWKEPTAATSVFGWMPPTTNAAPSGRGAAHA